MSIVTAFEPSTDDVTITGGGTSYPPPFFVMGSNTNLQIEATRSFEGIDFIVRNALVRFDTSGIGSAQTVESALYLVGPIGNDNDDGRSYVVQPYSYTTPSSADYAATAPTSGLAFSGLLADATINNTHYKAITNPASVVNKTGFTGFRFHISGGQPTGFNYLVMDSANTTAPKRPRLIVKHTYPSPPTTVGTHTVRFQIAAVADDLEVGKYSSATWPPDTPTDPFPGEPAIWISKGKPADLSSFETSNGLFAWDTSGIPDTATIDSGRLRFWAFYVVNTDNRNLVGEYNAWTGGASDFVQNVGSTALNVSLDTIDTIGGPVWTSHALNSVSGVNKSGYTRLRLGISGTTQPTGENIIRLYTSDDATGVPPPELELTYTVPAGGGATAKGMLGGVSN